MSDQPTLDFTNAGDDGGDSLALAGYAQLKPPAPVLTQRALPGRVRMELSGGAQNRGNLPPAQVAQTRSAPQTAFEPLPTIPNE